MITIEVYIATTLGLSFLCLTLFGLLVSYISTDKESWESIESSLKETDTCAELFLLSESRARPEIANQCCDTLSKLKRISERNEKLAQTNNKLEAVLGEHKKKLKELKELKEKSQDREIIFNAIQENIKALQAFFPEPCKSRVKKKVLKKKGVVDDELDVSIFP